MENQQTEEKVEVYSASPLEKETVDLLFEKFPFLKKTNIVFKIDRQLIAGILIKRKNQILDLSLRNLLLDFKKITYEVNH